MTTSRFDAPEVGLYLRCCTEETNTVQGKLIDIFRAINRHKYKRNMHILEIDITERTQEHYSLAWDLANIAMNNGIVALVRQDASFVKAAKTDGLVVSNIDDLVMMREALGDDVLIAISDIDSIDAGEEARKKGADLIGIRKTQHYQNDLAILGALAIEDTTPILAQGAFTTLNMRDAITMGASFIECSSHLLQDAQDPQQATQDILTAIDDILMSYPY